LGYSLGGSDRQLSFANLQTSGSETGGALYKPGNRYQRIENACFGRQCFRGTHGTPFQERLFAGFPAWLKQHVDRAFAQLIE
jgi:hypothetical protein